MRQGKERHVLNLSMRLGISLLAVLGIGSLCRAQQGAPLLQITSPVAGTVVNPGQTISVSVTSPANASLAAVGVVAEDPIGFSDNAAGVPAQFSFTIPTADIACKPYMLTAFGVTSSGQSAQSDTILIDVERPDMPASLSALMPSISFSSIGEKSPIRLLATFTDGSILDVTGSSYVAYSSSNTSVATVDANGVVTAVATGSASLTATYTLNGQDVQVAIPVTVPPQIMTVSPGSISFVGQNVGTSSATQQLTVTNASDDTLKIVHVASSGDFAESDNCAAASPLPAGGTCTVDVAFIPTGTGTRTGAVTIGNAFSIIPTVISLSGTGIGQPTTSTSLASSANPSVFGQSVTLTATVSSASGTPTGTMTFSDGSTVLGTQSLNGGQATFTTSSFSVGSHSITAVYSGDSTFQGSTGTLTQTINPASMTTFLSSSANPSILNSSITLTATVSVAPPGAGTPTGSVAFSDGATALTTVPINSAGQAAFSTSALAVGTHAITAAYSGDSNFSGSTSAALSQSVQYQPAGTLCSGQPGHQILQPINTDGTSVFKQGSTVPAKFAVCDANGISIGAAGVVSSFVLLATQTGTVVDQVNEPVLSTTPDSSFRWDPTAQQWIFNIATSSLAANMTYFYRITLNDGTVINFSYGLK